MEIMDNAPTLEDAVNECVALKTKIKELEAENQKLGEAIKKMYYDNWNCEYCEKNGDIAQKVLEE
jgi:uncharacterized protein with PIN domain